MSTRIKIALSLKKRVNEVIFFDCFIARVAFFVINRLKAKKVTCKIYENENL